MNRHKRYPPEVRERAVRLVLEHQENYDSQWAALTSIAGKIGCTAETLRKWVRRAEVDQGKRAGCQRQLKTDPPWVLFCNLFLTHPISYPTGSWLNNTSLSFVLQAVAVPLDLNDV